MSFAFIMVPTQLLDCARTREEELVVFRLCQALDAGRGTARVQQRALGEECGVTRSSVAKLFVRMRETDLLETRRSGNWTVAKRGTTWEQRWNNPRTTPEQPENNQTEIEPEESSSSEQPENNPGTTQEQPENNPGTPKGVRPIRPTQTESDQSEEQQDDLAEARSVVFATWKELYCAKHSRPRRQPCTKGSGTWHKLNARLRENSAEDVALVIDWLTNSNSWQAQNPASVGFDKMVEKRLFDKYIIAAQQWASKRKSTPTTTPSRLFEARQRQHDTTEDIPF